jgi:hypothetical protein
LKIEFYEKARDREHCLRIWEECGWIDSLDGHNALFAESHFEAGRALVARPNGEAECLVLAATGSLRYLEEDVPFSGVTGVTTSRVARRQRLASRLTSRLIAEEADAGAAVSGLGMFEQGYYNRFGFGSGPYDIEHHFDPALLKVEIPERVPLRLTRDDYARMHANRSIRKRAHGGVAFDNEMVTRGDVNEGDHGFGLGFSDDGGETLTHHLWCRYSDAEYGPYKVAWLAYRTQEELLELLGLLRGLGDQVRSFSVLEPVGVQLQDLLNRPIHHRQLTHRARFAVTSGALAWWQIRICDLERCLRATHLDATPIQFNLSLSDPISIFLEERKGWRGIGGEYVVTVGPESEAKPGSDSGLPTLKASINAFSRMWLGVRPASVLAVSDELEADASLLHDLDRVFRLPSPRLDWEF